MKSSNVIALAPKRNAEKKAEAITMTGINFFINVYKGYPLVRLFQEIMYVPSGNIVQNHGKSELNRLFFLIN